jgi:hypothetical protein
VSQPAVQTGKPSARPDPQAAEAALIKVVGAAVDNGLAHIRRIDPDTASDIDAVRRRDEGRPVVVIVGETKRGKSSLVNALIGAPNLSPVDAAVATSAYLEFKHGQAPSARAWLPGDESPVPLEVGSLRDWGTVLGQLPDGVRPPRRIEITYPAPMLEFVDIVDTPGVGGLDSAHAEIALDAVENATALLFVVDASAPFSQPELNFLSEASKRVNLVLFALTKTDIYPGWRTVMDDDIRLLQAHAPRFGQAGFFPVSSALAEVAATLPPEAAGALLEESRIGILRKALSDGVAARGELLKRANVLRTVRSELIRLDQLAGDKIRTADPDPATLQELKDERGKVAAKKRSDTRSWQVSMSTEIKRSRTDITSRVRTETTRLQEYWMAAIDKAGNEQIKRLPYDVDRSLHALALRMTADMQHRFRVVGARILNQVFTPQEIHRVLSRLNSQLQARITTKPRREKGSQDGLLMVTASASPGLLAGRAVAGAGALIAGSAGAVIAFPVAIGLGLAAGAFMLYRRRVTTNRQEAKVWLREVLAEARASLGDAVSYQFTDLEHNLTLALEEAIDRRIKELDKQIGDIDRALAEDAATRKRKRSEFQGERDQIRSKLGPLDEALIKLRRATAVTGAEGTESAG